MRSLVAEVEYENEVIENYTRDDDFNEITVVVSGYYYGAHEQGILGSTTLSRYSHKYV